MKLKTQIPSCHHTLLYSTPSLAPFSSSLGSFLHTVMLSAPRSTLCPLFFTSLHFCLLPPLTSPIAPTPTVLSTFSNLETFTQQHSKSCIIISQNDILKQIIVYLKQWRLPEEDKHICRAHIPCWILEWEHVPHIAASKSHLLWQTKAFRKVHICLWMRTAFSLSKIQMSPVQFLADIELLVLRYLT